MKKLLASLLLLCCATQTLPMWKVKLYLTEEDLKERVEYLRKKQSESKPNKPSYRDVSSQLIRAVNNDDLPAAQDALEEGADPNYELWLFGPPNHALPKIYIKKDNGIFTDIHSALYHAQRNSSQEMVALLESAVTNPEKIKTQYLLAIGSSSKFAKWFIEKYVKHKKLTKHEPMPQRYLWELLASENTLDELTEDLELSRNCKNRIVRLLSDRRYGDNQFFPVLTEFMLDSGNDPNAPDENGNTPLMWTIDFTHYRAETMPFLLKNDRVDINAQNKRGKTALLLAGRKKTAQTLLEHGADPTIKDYEGRDFTGVLQRHPVLFKTYLQRWYLDFSQGKKHPRDFKS